jgi:hypothetical protein
MHLCTKETFADSAGTKHVIVLRLAISDHLYHSLSASGTPLNVDVKITATTDQCPPIRFSLGDCFKTSLNPFPESLETGSDIVPGEGS